MRIGLAIKDVRDAEERLATRLNLVGERHKADHDVYHLTGTLQALHRANLERLAPFGERYGTPVDPEDVPDDHGHGLRERVREKGSELLARRPETGLLLLRDLRALHLLYAEASIDWVILQQGAKAVRDAGLVGVASDCHAQTLRGMKWTVTRIKVAAPQVLSS